MLKKLVTVSLISMAAFEMVGCTEGNNTMGSTAAGAIAGGVLGGTLFHNTAAGAIGGAVLGGVIGNQIGQYMDRQDRANMQNAVSTVPVGQEAQWTNKEGAQYTVRPVKNYSTSSHKYCREYQTTVTVNGETKKAYGKACRQPDGSWKIVS
ncbi:MAG: hypothetical protein A3E84_04540 [Gammaproteobacteria bacterium RIFCSPHIGHO2_12_FULL_42_13]|nr:MAG: hypothetical protein A3E84_04540 [Gammaproteobacteria bacterium RIFCSPHIGHO2_12_FULL_42_13]